MRTTANEPVEEKEEMKIGAAERGKKERTMKCFQVDDVSWYAGNTAQEAVDAYVADIGTDEARELCAEFGEPVEISEADLDLITVTDVDEPGQPKHTFREALAQRKTPGFIATTEY